MEEQFFLGVDDNYPIKSLKEDVKRKIEDLIAEHYDSLIDSKIDSEVLLQEAPITIVKVQKRRINHIS